MKAIAAVALAGVAAAVPTSKLEERIARRAAGLTHDPSPLIPAKGPVDGPENNGTYQIEYSSNWAGAVQTSPPAGTTFSEVSGYFNIPTPSPPSGASSGSYAASAWAGIDGDTYGNAILQSGCDFTADTSGGTYYDCWYEWFPNPLTDFPGFNPSPGDTIYVNLVATSSSTGTATLTNTRSGDTVTQILNAPSQQALIAGQNAEWIVEDFSSGGGLVPFANFGQVTFTGCSAQAGGDTVGTGGATILDITQNGAVLTSVSIPDGSTVQVQYQ